MHDSCEQMTHQEDWEDQIAGGPLPPNGGVPIHKGIQPRCAVTCIAGNIGTLSAHMQDADIWLNHKGLDTLDNGYAML